jgi:xylulokinase
VDAPDDHFALAVDLGTGGPKVGLVSLTGELAWFEHLSVQTRVTADGGAEQDAGEWWRLIGDAARRASAGGVVDPTRIRAVAVTGQWASRIPVDADGKPVGACVMWMDTRGRRHSKDLIAGPAAGFKPAKTLRWIRRSGGVPSPGGADPISHVLYLQRDCPEIAAASRWFLEPVDYLTMRFTGRATATPASMLAAWLTDNRDLSAAPAYDAALVAMAGVDASRLPPLIPTGSVIGQVRDDVASDLGLSAGVQVVTGVPDLHAATVGSGAAGLYQPHLSISTTGWISCPLPKKKTDALRAMATVPGIGDGNYVIANSIDTAGVCLEWARATLDAGDYPEMVDAAATAPPGSNGVVFTPWLGGTRSPAEDRNARAAWHGMSLQTTQADLVRAVLEGVACHARWLHEAVERLAKRRLEPIRIIGGGAQSDLWCQIHADVMDRRIERIADPASAVLRGGALLAAVALEAVDQAQLRDLVTVDRAFTPDAANRAVYDRLFVEMPRLHKAQRGMSSRLRPQS